MIYSRKFKLTDSRRLQIDNIFKGYADGLITDDETNDMLDILFGDIEILKKNSNDTNN